MWELTWSEDGEEGEGSNVSHGGKNSVLGRTGERV